MSRDVLLEAILAPFALIGALALAAWLSSSPPTARDIVLPEPPAVVVTLPPSGRQQPAFCFIGGKIGLSLPCSHVERRKIWKV